MQWYEFSHLLLKFKNLREFTYDSELSKFKSYLVCFYELPVTLPSMIMLIS